MFDDLKFHSLQVSGNGGCEPSIISPRISLGLRRVEEERNNQSGHQNVSSNLMLSKRGNTKAGKRKYE